MALTLTSPTSLHLGARIVIACHDELVMECPQGQTEAVVRNPRMIMVEGMDQTLHPGFGADHSTYSGMYVPSPLWILCKDVEQTAAFLTEEIQVLTKLNWNNTQFDNRNPITIRAARGVGQILKYVEEGHSRFRYSYYM